MLSEISSTSHIDKVSVKYINSNGCLKSCTGQRTSGFAPCVYKTIFRRLGNLNKKKKNENKYIKLTLVKKNHQLYMEY
jgi:hypothetical protein